MGWVMYFLYRRGDKNVRLIDYSRVGLDLRALKKSIPYLILTLGIPLLTYNILAYVLDLPLWWPRPISWTLTGDVLIAFGMIFIFYLSIEVISKTQLLEQWYEFPNYKGYIQEIVINGTITFVILIVAYLIGGLGMNADLKWLITQDNNGAMIMLVVNGLILLIQGYIAYMGAYLYARTKSIFTVALFEAIIVILLITGKLAFIYAVF